MHRIVPYVRQTASLRKHTSYTRQCVHVIPDIYDYRKMFVSVRTVAWRVVRAGVESPSRWHRGAAAAQPEVDGRRRRARGVLHQKHVRGRRVL